MDFLVVVEGKTLDVVLDSKGYTISKPTVFQFFKLNRLLIEVKSDPNKILEFVTFAVDQGMDIANKWYYGDVLEVFNRIVEFIQPVSLHIDFVKDNKESRKYEYTNRALAILVTKLASAFHWERDFILYKLSYDEAKAYMQEIVLMEHQRSEFDYSLSDVAYDKKGKYRKYSQIPFPPSIPGTGIKFGDNQIRKIPDSIRPYGVVKLENYNAMERIIN